MTTPGHPHIAVYSGRHGRRFDRRPVAAWNDNGEPLVLGDDFKLVRARELRGFQRVEATPQMVGVLPGGGWGVQYEERTGPVRDVLAWTFDGYGVGRPVVVLDEFRRAEPLADHHRAFLIPPNERREGDDTRPATPYRVVPS